MSFETKSPGGLLWDLSHLLNVKTQVGDFFLSWGLAKRCWWSLPFVVTVSWLKNSAFWGGQTELLGAWRNRSFGCYFLCQIRKSMHSFSNGGDLNGASLLECCFRNKRISIFPSRHQLLQREVLGDLIHCWSPSQNPLVVVRGCLMSPSRMVYIPSNVLILSNIIAAVLIIWLKLWAFPGNLEMG